MNTAPLHAPLKKAALGAGLALATAFHADALTIREENRYYTDFKDPGVDLDFSWGAALRDSNGVNPFLVEDPPGVVTTNLYYRNGAYVANNAMTFYSEYGFFAGAVLLSGGKQWTGSNVRIGRHDWTSVTDNFTVTNRDVVVMGKPNGLFRDTIATITYTLDGANNLANYDKHKNITVSLQARKTKQPHEYRQHCYFAKYDGARLSLNEYTGYWQGHFREIAGTAATVSSSSSVIKFRISVMGGSDGVMSGNATNFFQSGASPTMLEAHLWENGALIASVYTRDDPFDWINGPEQPDCWIDINIYPPPNDVKSDYGNGKWYPPGEIHTDWYADRAGQAPWRGNNDIAEEGWTGIGFQAMAGSRGQINVHTFEVVKSLIQPTLFLLK